MLYIEDAQVILMTFTFLHGITCRNLAESAGGKLNLMGAGTYIKSIFGLCDIRQFTDTTECLQEEVMSPITLQYHQYYVNRDRLPNYEGYVYEGFLAY